MATIRLANNFFLGSPTTSRLLAITSAETLYTIGSGNRAFEMSNLGSFNVYYGQSGVLANSGNLLLPSASKMFDSVIDNFSFYLVAASGGVTSNVIVVEHAGN